MANPKGNPNFGKTIKFTTDRPEPLKIKIGLRITESMNSRLDTLPDKNEFIRQAIATALDAMDGLDSDVEDLNLGKLLAS